MRPVYGAARLEDLGPDDRIKVECGGCRRVALIAADGLGLGFADDGACAGLPPYTDTRSQARCDVGDAGRIQPYSRWLCTGLTCGSSF
jgi:hypothetical protein